MKIKNLSMGVLMIVLLVVSSVGSFAATMPANGPAGMANQKMGDVSFLEEFVDSGVITQAELDDIEDYMSTKTTGTKPTEPPQQPSEGTNPMDTLLEELKDEGLLTASQMAAIQEDITLPTGPMNKEEGVKPTQDSSMSNTTPVNKPAVTSADGITVKINGVKVVSDVQAFVDGNNRTMIELRSVAEALGAEISWDNDTKTASLELDDEIIEIQIGNGNYKLNGTQKQMDTAAVITDGRTMVPVRVVSEALGATVVWDASTKTVLITQ